MIHWMYHTYWGLRTHDKGESRRDDAQKVGGRTERCSLAVPGRISAAGFAVPGHGGSIHRSAIT